MDAPAAEGTWNSYEGIVAANAENKTYDSHYLVGNYYQLNTATAGTVDGVAYDIALAPLYYVRGGAFVTSSFSVSDNVPGINGGYWYSSTSTHDRYSYNLLFGMSQIIQANNDFPRFAGMQVRCVAR